MIEAAELQGGPPMIIDLRLDLPFRDRLGQVGQSRSVDASGGAADRLPSAGGVPLDPPLGHGIRGRSRRVGKLPENKQWPVRCG